MMNKFFTLILIMIASTMNAQDGKAVTTKKTFSRTTAVEISIHAEVEKVWSILTNAADFPRWNSTITSLEGEIATGEKIRLVSTLAPDRTFKLKIKKMTPNEEMIWGDAMGKRTYTLQKSAEGVVFSMSEKIGGPLFPLFAGKVPDFSESFEQFAADLKAEAEK